MDPTTLLGIILGFALIVNGIGFAKIGNFIDIPSMVIVIGGALSAKINNPKSNIQTSRKIPASAHGLTASLTNNLSI